jgi:hypothetical protein
MDASLCIAMKDGLRTNVTLWHLHFKHAACTTKPPLCGAGHFPFSAPTGLSSPCWLTHRDLSVLGWHNAEAEDFIALVTAFQYNRTLKTLQFDPCEIRFTDDEDKLVIKIIKKNYALEGLPDAYVKNLVGDAGAILQLNTAGRRYLIEDPSAVSKGVEVLSAVRSDINCVSLHILENSRLCDRSAVESASDITDNGGSTSLVNHHEKREHGQALEEGNAPRRRRT